jgi:hypothetical protein
VVGIVATQTTACEGEMTNHPFESWVGH